MRIQIIQNDRHKAEKIPESREDQNVEGEKNVVGEGQEGDQADEVESNGTGPDEVEPNQAEPGDAVLKADNRPNDPVAGTDETVVPNVANHPRKTRHPQRKTRHPQSPTTVHILCARTRRLYRCGAIITQFDQFQQQQPYQPFSQSYQIPMPTQNQWHYNYSMFPSHW